MIRILVIADDLSGAAEIAGIGTRFGLRSRIVLGPVDEPPQCQLLVIDTDSRHLVPRAAASRLRRCLQNIRPNSFDVIYKKTDSALRGPIAAELAMLLSLTGKTSSILLAQNPSRGRMIIDGRYFIDNIPLHRTSFRNDPTHPAKTHVAHRLVHGDVSKPHPIRIADASSKSHVRQWVMKITSNDLPAGGADFFSAILAHRLPLVGNRSKSHLRGRALFVCGTASEQRSRLREAIAKRHGIFISIDEAKCAQRAIQTIGDNRLAALAAPEKSSPAQARTIERALANRSIVAIADANVQTVFIEGGATAAAFCRVAGLSSFDVLFEVAPGIVALRSRDRVAPVIIVKPGSYPWPAMIWRPIIRSTSTQRGTRT